MFLVVVSSFPTKLLWSFVIFFQRATFPAQQVFLDVITVVILGDKYKQIVKFFGF